MERAREDQLLRRLNDDRRERFGQPERMLALICECADPSCRRTVLMTADEYDRRRPGLILHPSHAA